MWDFTNAGAAAPDKHTANFGYMDLMGGVAAYTAGMHFRKTRENSGLIFNQVDRAGTTGTGVTIGIIIDGGGAPGLQEKIYVTHDTVQSVWSPGILVNVTYSYLIVWSDSAGLLIYRNGVLWHTDAAFLTVPTVPKRVPTTIGADPEFVLQAPPGQVGNIAAWPDIAMVAPDAVMWHNGIMPHRGSVRFFHRCIELPGKDEYSRRIPDCYGSDMPAGPHVLPLFFHDNVSLYSDPSDDYYSLHGETIHTEMQILAGEELHRRRLVEKSYKITTPTQFLAQELGEDLQLTHKGGLECTGEGFGYGDAPTRLVRIEGMSLNPEDRMVDLSLRDIKRHAVSYYNAFRAPYTITGRQLGIDQLMPTFAAKETTRASYSWGKDLDGIYQEYGRDQEPAAGKGLLSEALKRNYVANAAFKHQLTSWVTVDPGTGTVTAVYPGIIKAFDDSITGYAIELACGTPFVGNQVAIRQTVSGTGSALGMTLSFIYYAETGGQIWLRAQRTSDNWYLQTLTGPWAAPVVNLVVPFETSYKSPYRYVQPYLYDATDTYVFTLYSAGEDGKIIWVYHVQFEEGSFATEPVVNESNNAYIRSETALKLRNPDGLLLPKEHGTAALEFEPLWDSAEGFLFKALLHLVHDTQNYIELFWTVAGGFSCNWKYNNVNHSSSLLGLTWSAGDTIKVAIRWLDDGELGKENAQGQLFVKVGSAAWQESIPKEFTQDLQALAESILYVGSTGFFIANHYPADGYIRYLHCFPEALPFEEIQALLGESS